MHAQELFLESGPWVEIPRSGGGPPFLPLTDPTDAPTGFFTYTPPEVEDPDFGDGLPHPAQKLSCFWPRPPLRGETFPAIVWVTSGATLQGSPMTMPEPGLLSAALDQGWAVITVGSVGIDSLPVVDAKGMPTQPPRCHPLGGGTPLASGCWDYNMWYAPDAVATSPWNDFNYFYGEKDIVWARQYIAENSAMLRVDNDRLVFGGTSSGAIYASFLALMSQPWQASTFPGLTLSDQVQADTTIAGLIFLEPVGWLEGVPPNGTTGPGIRLEGFHWPLQTDPFRRTDWASQVTPLDVLKSNSPSRWIRASARKVPAFIASGDGSLLSTRFGRNGNDLENAMDYSRNPSSSVPNDPVLSFASTVAGFSLLLHDGWQAWNLRKDLDLADAVFHNRYSVLYMRKDLNWSFFPTSLVAGGGTLSSPLTTPPYVVQLLHETYEVECPDGSSVCLSLNNLNLGPRVVDWLDCVFASQPIGVACATADRNPYILTSTRALLGQALVLTVDVEAAAAGYDHAAVFGFSDFGGNSWLRVPVAGVGGTSLLCYDANSSGDVIMGDLSPKDATTGLTVYSLPVPNDPLLSGTRVTAQACVYDLCATGSPGHYSSCTPVAPASKLITLAGNGIDVIVLAP